jgi:hypothetical protein
MSQLIRSLYDKALLALMVGAVALSLVWSWRQQAGIRQMNGEAIAPDLSGPAYAAPQWHLPEPTITAWPKAPAQSQGSGWLYEIFTPPVIYYNTAARSFAVTPPQYPTEPGGVVFGLELLAVKLEPYRLQLLGYFGAPGDYLAAFVSPQSPETLLARAGRRFDQLGLTLKSFDVRKVTVESSEPGTVYDVAALAVLQDEQTGAEVVLDSRTRKLTDTPLAVFRLPGAPGKSRELHEGDTFDDEGATYRIERIQLDPPEVVVARTAPGLPVPEMRVLRPPAQLAGKTTKPKPLAPQPARGVATTGQ